MQTEAAIVWELNTPWSVGDNRARPSERGRSSGQNGCLLDFVILTTTSWSVICRPGRLMVGGHEGAGVIQEVGPGVTEFEVGDHVVFGFLPACGRCPSCVTGHSNMCDSGAQLAQGRRDRWHFASPRG